MDAETRIEAYYDALEAGDPLVPFFASDDTVVKFGISEVLTGGAAVARGLREQTERTTNWSVDSRSLRITERDRYAWFSDDVGLAWRDLTTGDRHEFETRWSGTLERRTTNDRPASNDRSAPDDRSASDDQPAPNGTFVFVGMHVSTARSF